MICENDFLSGNKHRHSTDRRGQHLLLERWIATIKGIHLGCHAPLQPVMVSQGFTITSRLWSIVSNHLRFCLYLVIPQKNPYSLSSVIHVHHHIPRKNAGCLSQIFIILSPFFTHTLGLFEGSRLPTTDHQAISRPRHGVRPGICGFRASSARGESQHMETLGHGELREYHGIIMEISWDYHGNIMVSMVNDGSLDWKNREKKNRKLRKPWRVFLQLVPLVVPVNVQSSPMLCS